MDEFTNLKALNSHWQFVDSSIRKSQSGGAHDITLTTYNFQDFQGGHHLQGVTMSVADNTPFELEARTGSGRIDSRLPVNPIDQASKHRLRGRVGSGGARVEFSTGSGGIRIE